MSAESHPGHTATHADTAYELRQLLNAAVRPLRDAEDLARVQMPAYPTADRIREIYEQISEDVLNGKTNLPPLRQRLTEAEDQCAAFRDLLRRIYDRSNCGAGLEVGDPLRDELDDLVESWGSA